MMTNRLKWIFSVFAAFFFIGIGGNAWADGNRRDARNNQGYNDRYRNHERRPFVRPGTPAPRKDDFRRSPHFKEPRRHHSHNGPQRRGQHYYPPARGHRDYHRRPYVQPPQRHHRHHYQAYPQRTMGAGYVFSASIFEPGLALSFATGGQW